MVSLDDRLFPSHISLYMALFQIWNANRFENPVSIYRKEVLRLCKIGSLNTYHKCLHDLHDFGYIKYEPSHNQFIGSVVSLYNFDTSSKIASPETLQNSLRRNFDTTIIQALRHPRRKIDTTVIQALRHSINNINILNNKHSERQSQNENEVLISSEIKNEDLNSNQSQNERTKRKKVAPKKEKAMLPPAIDDVIAFFRSENYPDIEANKFFNHFESNGWKVGGKTPMVDWNAAARNWILNCQSFASSPSSSQTKSLIIPSSKNYNEPL